ncbi:MAG: hypothetical protein ACPGUE_09895 [Marinomonas sp.]
MPAPISGEKIDELAVLKDRKDLSAREKAERLGVTHPIVLKYERMMEEMGISIEYLSMFNDKEKQLIFNPDFGKRKSNLAEIDAQHYLQKIRDSYRKKSKYTRKSAFKEHKEKHKEKAGKQARFYKALKDEEKAGSKQLRLAQVYHPGEVFFVDFAGAKLPYGENNELEANFIVGCYGHSSLQKYRATASQTTGEWLGFIQDCQYWAGGKVLRIVHDNTTSLVATPLPNLKLNKIYQVFKRHFDFIVSPIPKKMPNYNALAEVSVKIFTSEVLPLLESMSFNTLEEMNEVIAEQEDIINSRVLTGDIESRKVRFFRDEVPALGALPDVPFEMPENIRKIKPPSTWNFDVDGVDYPIPYDDQITTVTLLIRKHEIEVMADGDSLCVHTRLKRGEIHDINPSHLPEKYRDYFKENQAFFADWARDIAPSVVKFVNKQYNGVSTPDYDARRACKRMQALHEGVDESLFIGCCDYLVSHGEFDIEALDAAISSDLANPDISADCLALLAQFDAQNNSNNGGKHVH